jgi:hypothetical protein
MQTPIMTLALGLALALPLAALLTPTGCGAGNAHDDALTSAIADAGADERGAASATGDANAAPATGDAASPSPCGSPDVGGWTTFVPSKLDANVPLMDRSQPGSRIHYISVETGDDATASVYFWDGARIVDAAGRPADDAGNAYGVDPMNPSAAVKAFKTWSWVAPRRGETNDIGSDAAPGEARPGTRAGFPDWFLFKRGETIDLLEDLRAFAKEKNPDAGDPAPNMSLSLSAGRSASERKLMSAYGDPCAPRPRFVHPAAGFISIFATPSDPIVSHIAYASLHFDGHDRTGAGSYSGLTLLGQTDASVDILAEDLWFDGISSNIQNEAEVILRRCLMTDAFGNGTSHVEGLFYGGKGPKGRLRIEESIFLRNGFRNADPKTFAWPPSGTNQWDIFDRNLYVSGENDPMGATMIDSVSMIGTSGDQFRGGRRVERNFFYQGYVNMGGYNGAYAATPSMQTGTIVDNVLQNFVGAGTDDNRGHPGWGITLGGGAQHVEVSGNITTNAAVAKNTWRAFAFAPSITDCLDGVTFLRGPNQGNHIHDNVFDSDAAPAAIQIYEGSSDPCLQWKFPSTTGNTIDNNVLVNASKTESVYTTDPSATGKVDDTVFSGNAIYESRAAAAAALGWPDPNRTLKTYLASQGVSVTSADGFPEYFERATALRKGKWSPAWTARPLVNYVRAGFGRPPL